MDGQQRITSFGRYVTGKFGVMNENGKPLYFPSSLPEEQKQKILNSQLTIYICEGEETEIKDWFITINIAGIPLSNQEFLNSIYSGVFVTKAREEFSNSNNANVQKWSAYIKGDIKRQDYLETALEWVSRGNIEDYMSKHRRDDNIKELKSYFNGVIEWVSSVFIDVEREMKGIEWGRLFETYHHLPYNPTDVSANVHRMYSDPFVKNRRGVFEYILGGCIDTKLLDIRIFEESTKRAVYSKQTDVAKKDEKSNCPLCAIGNDNNRKRIWKFDEMDADHVTAWSNGGSTNIENCQILCRTHNRAKGNR